MAENDRMTVKELLASRWKAHRDAFRAAGFQEADGSVVFVAVDRYLAPPEAVAIACRPGERPVAARLALSGDAEARGDMVVLAKRVLAATEAARLDVSEALSLVGMGDGGSPLAALSARRFAESFHDPRVVSRLPLADLQASEAKRLDEAGLSKARDSFDRDALRALSAVDSFQWRDYAFYAEPGEKGKMRRQAAEIYPLLATVFVQRPSIKLAIDNQRPLNEAIQAAFGADEGGKPKLPKAIVSRLQRVSWPTNGISPEKIAHALSEIPPDWFPKTREEWDAFCDIHATVGTVARQATGLGPEALYSGCAGKWAELRERLAHAFTDKRPPEGTTEEVDAYFREAIDWKSFEGMPAHKVKAAAIEAVSRLDRLPEGIPAYAVVEWIERLHAPDQSREALRGACTVVEDMVDAFAKKVVLPLAANETGLNDVYLSELQIDEARTGAARVLFSGKAATNIFELARHFHSQMPAIMQAGADKVDDEERRRRDEEARRAAALSALGIDYTEIPDDGWPPLSAAVQAPNGVWIVPLTDPRHLEDEGRPGYGAQGSRECADGSLGLAHCVGGYAGTCRNGGHILSMRELTGDARPTFRRLSTVEIRPIAHGQTDLDVRQHHGANNGQAPEKARRAFEWYQEEIKAGRVQLNYDKIREYIGSAGAKQDDVEKRCDYDWRERRRIAEAMYPWGQYVGKKYRRMKIDDFAKEAEIANVAYLMNPTRGPRR